MLEYKCRQYGQIFLKIDPRRSSQICSAWGFVHLIRISSEGDSSAQDQVSGRNKPVRGLLKKRQKSWRVLRAVFIFPFLGKSFVRDFSPLRRVLVLGGWEMVVSRLVPAPGAGAMGGQKPPGGAGHPEKAEYKYPTQNCTNVQFC